MFKNYITTAWRTLSRNKAYATINILGLASGLAIFWLIALYVGDELSYDRYNVNADRIVRVVQHASWGENTMNIALTSAPFAPALQAKFPEVENVIRIDPEGGGIIHYAQKSIKEDNIIVADPSILKIFTYHFLYGDAQSALANPNSVVLTKSLAEKIFGSAEQAINKTISFDANDVNTVTAIIDDIPANSHLQFKAIRALPAGYTDDNWQNAHLYTYLLLAKGVDYKIFEKKLSAFAAQTIQKEMQTKDYHMELQPLTSIHLHSNLDYEISANGSINVVYTFCIIALLILLIAVINYTNLSTARAAARVREIGVRKVIGSGRKQLTALFITEAVLVTLIAAFVAFLLVDITIPFFNSLSGKSLSVWRFGFTNTFSALIVFSLFIGLISGIYPSFFLSKFKTIPALKGQTGNLQSSILFRKSLVVLQFVITVVMICSSIIIYQQLHYALTADLGFNKEQVLTFHIDDRNVRNQIDALKTQLLKNSMIKGVAAAGNPIGNNDLGMKGFKYENNNGTIANETKSAEELMVDEDFLQTMQIQLKSGRNFSKNMPADISNAVLVNETLVKELGWKNAIGKQITKATDDNSEQPQTVVGVIKDFHTYSLQHKVDPLVLTLPPNNHEKDNLYVRIEPGKTPQALAYITSAYRQFDKSDPVNYHFLDENFAKQYAFEEKQGQLAFIFTLLAILISCLGLFGLITFTAAQRTKEIGIRKVLGAKVFSIVILLSKDFMQLITIALIIAIPIAWFAASKWLNNFAYRIQVEWYYFIAAGFLALIIALITMSVQTIKAALANPAKSLKTE